jgi:hypothetical protein
MVMKAAITPKTIAIISDFPNPLPPLEELLEPCVGDEMLVVVEGVEGGVDDVDWEAC